MGVPLGILGVIVLNMFINPEEVLSLVALCFILSVADIVICFTLGQFKFVRIFCLWFLLPFFRFLF